MEGSKTNTYCARRVDIRPQTGGYTRISTRGQRMVGWNFQRLGCRFGKSRAAQQLKEKKTKTQVDSSA